MPQYLGLFRAKDVEFFSETTKLLVNDDLMEDLIRVCKIMAGEDDLKTKILSSGLLFTQLKKR